MSGPGYRVDLSGELSVDLSAGGRAVLAPAARTDVVASVAEPSPTPANPSGEFESFEVSPGLLGFLPPFLIALACVGLFLSLTRQLRKVNVRQAALDAEAAAAAERDRDADRGADPDGGPDGARGPDGRTDRPGPR